jgi:hypothetical protein
MSACRRIAAGSVNTLRFGEDDEEDDDAWSLLLLLSFVTFALIEPLLLLLLLEYTSSYTTFFLLRNPFGAAGTTKTPIPPRKLPQSIPELAIPNPTLKTPSSAQIRTIKICLPIIHSIPVMNWCSFKSANWILLGVLQGIGDGAEGAPCDANVGCGDRWIAGACFDTGIGEGID